jgi:thioredoxin 1
MVNTVKEMTSENFSETINSNSVVLVDVWAPWCGPCKMLSPIIDELSVEMEGKTVVGKLDADTNTDLVKELGVRNIPTILVYKNGEIVERTSGFKNKDQLISLLNPHL